MIRFASVVLLALLTREAAGQDAACDRDGFREVLATHVTRYPRMQIEDVYKLLHQGVFGSEHAVPSADMARRWLDEELEALDPQDASLAPMIEPVAPGARVVRVHLRPFLASGGDPEALLDAFVETSHRVRGSVAEFRCAAALVRELGERGWSTYEWSSFQTRMIQQGLPASDHSGAFRRAYDPSYRVIAGDLVPALVRRGPLERSDLRQPPADRHLP